MMPSSFRKTISHILLAMLAQTILCYSQSLLQGHGHLEDLVAESPGSSAPAPWLVSCSTSAVSADWFSHHHCLSQQKEVTTHHGEITLSWVLVPTSSFAKKANNERKKSPRPLLLSCLFPHSKARWWWFREQEMGCCLFPAWHWTTPKSKGRTVISIPSWALKWIKSSCWNQTGYYSKPQVFCQR